MRYWRQLVFKKAIKDLFLLFGIVLLKKQKNPVLFFEIDEEFNTLYSMAQLKTQMSSSDNILRRERHYTLGQLLERASQLNGDVAECGCWRGLSAYQSATRLKQQNFKGTFYIFDSFEGLSDFKEEDISSFEKHDETRKKEFACGEDIVKSNLSEFDFIEYKKGWIPERFHEVTDKKFSFVHIDVDMYQPILDSVEFFYPRMVSGGIIVFDDYGYNYFPGAKKAVDEYVLDKNDFFLSLSSGQAFIIKK